MKKSIIAVCFLVISALFVQAAEKKQSFIIKDGTSLWNLKGKDMVWSATLTIGQPLVSVGWIPAKGFYEGREYELFKVKTDTNQEGFVISSCIAKDAIGLAVVTNQLTTLYSQPRDSAVMSTILPQMNVLALWEVPGKSDYYKIGGYANDSGNYIADKYVLASDVSRRDADINVSILLQAIKNQKKKEQKQKTLQIIMQKYAGSAFSSTVAELSAALNPETLSVEGYTAALTALDSLNIRDIPSLYGSVVVLVKKGDKLTSVQRTVSDSKVADKTGRWILVSTPTTGWVFDGYVKAE